MASMPKLSFADNPLLRDLVALVRRIVDETVGVKASFAEREEAALAVTNEGVRRHLKDELQAIADRLAPAKELLIDGVLYRRHEEGDVAYYSLSGPLPVHRYTFRLAGVHNGPLVVPLELEAGIVEGATPVLAFNVALGYGKHDMRSHLEDLEAARRVPPSRTTLEHLAQRIGREVRRAVPNIEPVVRRQEQVPEEAVGVSAGLDRTSVPMEEPLPADEAPKTTRKPRSEPYVRTPPAPMEVNYRMAYVGTVAMANRDGKEIVTRRYAARADDGPDDVVRRMSADIAAYLSRKPSLHVGLVQDGAPEMWSTVRSALEAEPLVTSWTEAIDRYHLAERLGEAAALLPVDEATRTQWLRDWQHKLDASDDAIEEIEATLIDWYVRVDATVGEKLWEHLVYIRNNKDRMRYVSLRDKGLPVGSGATEGACKSVIGMRTKRASEHWKEDGLGSVLTLRAMHLSDRLPAFWQRFRARYTKTVEVAA